MKIIITESQEKNLKQKIIFMLMDKQKLHQLEIDDRIYFVKNIGDEYTKIRFDKEDGWCGISSNLISELSDLTQFQRSEVQDLIVSWVENTLQMEVTSNAVSPNSTVVALRIPYK
jgi:hypothetical protein